MNELILSVSVDCVDSMGRKTANVRELKDAGSSELGQQRCKSLLPQAVT